MSSNSFYYLKRQRFSDIQKVIFIDSILISMTTILFYFGCLYIILKSIQHYNYVAFLYVGVCGLYERCNIYKSSITHFRCSLTIKFGKCIVIDGLLKNLCAIYSIGCYHMNLNSLKKFLEGKKIIMAEFLSSTSNR